MSQAQSLHRRIRSVKNAKQITKAMEVVAASRMRRVAAAAANTQAYANLAKSILARIALSEEARAHKFFQPSEGGNTLYVIFTSDRGLAGAYNANIFSTALETFTIDQEASNRPSVIAFGQKGARFFARFDGINLVGEYEKVDDVPPANVFAPVLEAINHGLSSASFTKVKIIYTRFSSAMSQTVQTSQLLPVAIAAEDETRTEIPAKLYEFEPLTEEVIEEALRLYLEAQLMQAKVDSAASEYAMRMVAMGSANRNASELIDDLTLELNASRQAAITAEIAEITGGANAISSMEGRTL